MEAKRKKLDTSRPYGTCSPPWTDHRGERNEDTGPVPAHFHQHGLYYDNEGVEILGLGEFKLDADSRKVIRSLEWVDADGNHWRTNPKMGHAEMYADAEGNEIVMEDEGPPTGEWVTAAGVRMRLNPQTLEPEVVQEAPAPSDTPSAPVQQQPPAPEVNPPQAPGGETTTTLTVPSSGFDYVGWANGSNPAQWFTVRGQIKSDFGVTVDNKNEAIALLRERKVLPPPAAA